MDITSFQTHTGVSTNRLKEFLGDISKQGGLVLFVTRTAPIKEVSGVYFSDYIVGYIKRSVWRGEEREEIETKAIEHKPQSTSEFVKGAVSSKDGDSIDFLDEDIDGCAAWSGCG